ncbi:nitrate ABC transporter substrate-binding protein [Flavobacterium cheongpyeongense]|uniref:Nitrate ABC transporter substrate-binding protein n=1 Tax=Flavobacterium cheongpyeongense TaxID=2212651 RepID=A0A2V4BPX3_9FLAO|nr:CmpA/NrtA family ABC transporter substrate-binding protein [Flavobacterium cheongpyeongense]PXY41039.1 nitrate ABC transporter substrate-binding protein [Flavobacterium cheongpyeongense]
MKPTLFRLSMLIIVTFIIFSFKGKNPTTTSSKSRITDPPTTKKLVLEKPNVTIGFIKLTDMAPLAIAKHLGFFDAEGLNVKLEVQANWRDILDKVLDQQIDGAQMLAGQPIAAAAGCGRQGALVTTFSMDLNGNAITVSKDVWSKIADSIPQEYGRPVHPIPASALMPALHIYKKQNKPFVIGVVSAYSNHNYQLRYWLAAAGINPGFYNNNNIQGSKGTTGGDVLLNITAPPQMPETLQAGTINAYCVGEPWNQQAVDQGIGVPVVTSREIWKNHPEKVFVMTKEFVEKYPNTAIAITKALIKAGKWLDDPVNRKEATRILSKSAYVDGDKRVIDNSMLGTFEFEKGDIRSVPDFNVFFRYNATYPYYSDGIWFLTQMKRWGQISEPKSNDWYHAKIKEIYKPEIWMSAARLLLEEGFLTKDEIPTTDGYKPASTEFIDNMVYDGKKPLEYIKGFKIGIKD